MLNLILLQVASPEGNAMYQFIWIGSMLFVFYFFMIRPQQNQKRAQRTLLSQMKKGQQVITVGGIHGKVYDIKEGTLILEIDNKGSKITVEQGAISWESTKRLYEKK